MIDVTLLHGYLGLFLLSFLAATIVPVGSEWLLVILLMKSLDPMILLLVATSGNVLGAATTYGIGVYGSRFLEETVVRIKPETREKAIGMYRTYGIWSLLLTWVPVIGDPLCLIAGMFRVRFDRFLVLVLAGKGCRYAGVVVVTLKLI